MSATDEIDIHFNYINNLSIFYFKCLYLMNESFDFYIFFFLGYIYIIFYLLRLKILLISVRQSIMTLMFVLSIMLFLVIQFIDIYYYYEKIFCRYLNFFLLIFYTLIHVFISSFLLWFNYIS